MSDQAVLVQGLNDAPPFTCPACGDTAPYGNAKGDILRCSECESRIAFGRPMPRVVIQPCDDRRFVKIRFETWSAEAHAWATSHEVEVDKDYCQAIWHNVASICR